jgi:hypothetical protein
VGALGEEGTSLFFLSERSVNKLGNIREVNGRRKVKTGKLPQYLLLRLITTL